MRPENRRIVPCDLLPTEAVAVAGSQGCNHRRVPRRGIKGMNTDESSEKTDRREHCFALSTN